MSADNRALNNGRSDATLPEGLAHHHRVKPLATKAALFFGEQRSKHAKISQLRP